MRPVGQPGEHPVCLLVLVVLLLPFLPFLPFLVVLVVLLVLLVLMFLMFLVVLVVKPRREVLQWELLLPSHLLLPRRCRSVPE